MKFAQVTRQRVGARENMFALHIAGCQDLGREVRDHDAFVDEFEASSLEAAKHIVIDAEMVADQGYDVERDLTVYPCCTGHARPRKPLAEGVCTGTGQAFTDDRTPQHLYRACPVCGKLVGAKRGVAPRHNAA